MSLFDLIPARYQFAAQLAGIVAIGAALMVGYYQFISYHEDVGYQRAKSACTADKLVAEQAANKREADYQSQLRKANHDAEERQAALAADIDSLNQQLARLRNDRDAMRSRVAALSAPAARNVANAAITVFSECADQYRAVAIAADQCLSDRQTMIDSWPGENRDRPSR
jgi:septal ring factor EnvC (AmiA/AmiB activator)